MFIEVLTFKKLSLNLTLKHRYYLDVWFIPYIKTCILGNIFVLWIGDLIIRVCLWTLQWITLEEDLFLLTDGLVPQAYKNTLKWLDSN